VLKIFGNEKLRVNVRGITYVKSLSKIYIQQNGSCYIESEGIFWICKGYKADQ
jgi:hypothetical protein